MDKIQQIRRAHANARPKSSNPAWCNTHRDLGVVLDHVESLSAEVSGLRNVADLAGEFVDEWLGEGDGVELDGLAYRMAEALARVSGRRDLSTDRQPIDSDTSCKWVEVDEYDCTTWETDCGRKWEFMNDGPVENDIKYCHGCGRSIELVDGRQEQNDDT